MSETKAVVERLREKMRERAGFMREAGHTDDAELDDEAADLIERLEARAEAAEAERDALRAAVIEAGRAAGASLADAVSSEFLLKVPAEVRLVVARLTSERDALPTDREAEWLDGITPEGRKALEQANG